MLVDWQQMVALSIVAVAAVAVGRRLGGQIAAFRGRPGRAGEKTGSACEGCPSSGGTAKTAKTNPAPLIQLQTKPPLHLRRPPTE